MTTITPFSQVTTHFQNNIQMLTPYIAQVLGDAVDEYKTDWIIEAINISCEMNARNWRYIRAILERWRIRGKEGEQKKAPGVDTSVWEQVS